MQEDKYIEKDFSQYLVIIKDFFVFNIIPILSITLISALFSVWFALNIVNEYRSSATLIPSSMSVQPSNLGGLSALGELAGLDMNTSGAANNLIGKELFKSKDFINKFIENNNLLVDLMASKGWIQESDQLILDKKIYNNGVWQRPSKGLIKSKPGPEEVYLKFYSKFSYTQERDRVITVGFTSFSPNFSKKVLSLLIEAVNDEVRRRDIEEAKSSRDFLISQLSQTEQVNVSNLIARLIEDEIKKIKLAEVKKEYVYSIVDSPSIPISRYGVPRSLICIFITLSGFFLSLVFVMLRSLVKRW